MKGFRLFIYNFFSCLVGLYLLFRKKTIRTLLGSDFPKAVKHPVIWIHAVSVGEIKAIKPLVDALKARRPNDTFLVTTITKTGHAQAKSSLPLADYHLFLPLDISWIIRPIVKRIQPDLVLISETDLWPNFLNAAKKSGAKITLVNGKLSLKTQQRLQKFPTFAGDLMGPIDLFCLQSSTYAKRFASLGITRTHVTGNLKCDADCQKLSPEELKSWKKSLGLEHAKVVVVGSSHDPEEALLLEVFQKLWETDPALKVLFVPRHPERFDAVYHLLQERGVRTLRYTQKEGVTGEEKVILIDQMGILQSCYQLGDLAIVAGSFTDKVGGHNLLEPAAFGVSVLFGPHMHAQPDLVDLIKEYEAGVQVSLSELENVLKILLKDSKKVFEMGRKGLKLSADMRGSAARTLEKILSS